MEYLRLLVSLPWSRRGTEKKTSHGPFLAHLRTRLDQRHYGLDTVKERILDYMAVLERKRARGDLPLRGPVLCLAGPPGVGKTSLAQGVADALGHGVLARMTCGGMQDEAEIRGHNRGYTASQPGQVVREMRRVGIRDPVFVLDEIDKLGGASTHGGPSSALLELLDAEQNHAFRDNYLGVPFDLSEVFFVATANVPALIPAALRDRLEIIELPGYTEDEKIQIAMNYILPSQTENSGLRRGSVRLDEAATRFLIRRYTREAGVRGLQRVTAMLCRKIARQMLEESDSPTEITDERILQLLGAPPHVEEELTHRTKHAGVAIGLAVTSAGGEVLFVEARRMNGGGTLTLTGHLGDVMKESAKAALSWVRANADRYNVEPNFYAHAEVHLHVPSGAIPKDGPSSGVAMVVALLSELTGERVRPNLAMSGEITLTGHVLPVGGIREKVLSGRRLGIDDFILPRQNAKDVEETLSEAVRRQINVHYVTDVGAAVEIALPNLRSAPGPDTLP